MQLELPQDGERRIHTWVLTLLKNSQSDQDGHTGSDYSSSGKTQNFGHTSYNKFCSVRSWALLSKMSGSPQVFYKEPTCPILDFGEVLEVMLTAEIRVAETLLWYCEV